MVTISLRRVEDDSPTRPTAPPKRISHQLLHGIARSRKPSSEAGDQSGLSRSLWRQALLWPSGPAAIFKKSACSATKVSNQTDVEMSCQDQAKPDVGTSVRASVEPKRCDDQPQDDELHDCSSALDCAPPCNNLLDLGNSIKKLALSNSRSNSSTASTPSRSLPSLSLRLVKRASLFQELREFCANGDTPITMFPDYFSDEEKLMVQSVAQELHLCCQVGEKNIAVYKMLGTPTGQLHHSRVLRSGMNHDNLADDVYVDVHELARHGKDGFVSRLGRRRLTSGAGVRRDMLWDVAELSATADSLADPMSEGGGGVYAVKSRSSGENLALFKPAEEEKFVREGLIPGEGAIREEVAYVLDSRSNGFSGVPPTAVARLQISSVGRAKQGAVQRFMNSSMGSMESFGMPFDLQKAKEFVPVDQVHRIALLDVRVFNTDRHPGNILLIGDKKPYTMVPIDHGCILPSWFHLSEARFDWLEYPQCREAFSPAALQYIDGLDAEEDAKTLRALGIREECVTTLKICTLFLQLAAARSKTLYWMGNFMQRAGCFQLPSPLETTVQRACERAGIPYTFKANEFDEQRGEIELGVLSRRPPNEFFLVLEHLLIEAMDSNDSQTRND